MQLQILLGPERGRTYELDAGEHLVGRGSDATLPLASELVSRQHARLSVSPGLARVTDLGSSNGTFLNGARVVGEVVAKAGDILLVGDFALKLHARTAPALAAAEAGSGSLLEVPPATLLRWVGVLKTTAQVAMTSPPLQSEVIFTRGHVAEVIVDARRSRDPMQALIAILRWKGTFEVTPLTEAPSSLLLGLDALLPPVGNAARPTRPPPGR